MGELKTWFQQVRRKMLDVREEQVAILQKIQSYRNPFLDTYFFTASVFGEEFFYITFLPLLAWEVGLRECVHMAVLMLFFCVGVGNWLKNTFLIPRPPHPRVWTPENEQKSDHGFPSTHTISFVAAPIYFMMYHYMDKFYRIPYYPISFFTAFTIIFISCISVIFSRMYNGYHSPQDVLGGTILGIGFIPLWYSTVRHWLDSLLTWNSIYAPMVTLTIAVLMIAFHPKPGAPTAALPESGMLFGTSAGVVVGVQLIVLFNFRTIVPEPHYQWDKHEIFGPLLQSELNMQITRFFFGMFLVAIVRSVSKALYSRVVRTYYPDPKDINWSSTIIKFLNYFTISCVIVCLIPVMFRLVGLHSDHDLLPPAPMVPMEFPRMPQVVPDNKTM